MDTKVFSIIHGQGDSEGLRVRKKKMARCHIQPVAKINVPIIKVLKLTMFIFFFKNLDLFDASRWYVNAANSCLAKDD